MNLIDKAFLLKKTFLFGALDLDLLLSIADKMELAHYKATDYVFQCNNDAYRIYLILSGRVTIIDPQGTHIAEIHAGDFFGDESMFNDKSRGYGAYCKTKVEILSLPRSYFHTIIQECPSVALSLLEAYTVNNQFRLR